ncbi:MAG: DNA translocase FtsK, partial [Firmicutes bacterium]|nr:DNA translocase FtsK [Bacillota bacterium]
VSDGEVHKVLEHVKSQGEPAEYSADVIKTIDNSGANAPASDDSDELLAEAIETVVSSGQASVSMLQRRFRIGYNRAARIVDMMEARGIIGPADGSRPRQVLISQEELDAMKAEGTETE